MNRDHRTGDRQAIRLRPGRATSAQQKQGESVSSSHDERYYGHHLPPAEPISTVQRTCTTDEPPNTEPVSQPLPRLSIVARLSRRISLVLRQEKAAGQGRHIDPEAPETPPPSADRWTAVHRHASKSAAMRLFADNLRPPGGGSVRDGVISDLAGYYHLSPAQVIERCLRWEADSIEEWQAAPRDTTAGLAEFYNSVESWSFDLLWYAYLQTAGYGYPGSVIVADHVGRVPSHGRMLDLGSGVGATAQLFASLGWDVTLADVSATLLAFAQWRHERRGVKATYLHLPDDMPAAAYDLITALDVFAHIPDVSETAGRLHRALRPGGLLITNFDVRRRSDANAWHLYEDDLPLRWAVQRAGFTPVELIDGAIWVYSAEPTDGAAARLQLVLAWVRLASPPARALRKARRFAARVAPIALHR